MQWIKVNKELHSNVKVVLISEELGLDPEIIAYKLIRMWTMADSECTVEKPFIEAPCSVLDRLVGCPGLSQAMANVGWLTIHPDRIEFPKFDRHMGKSAKSRMIDSERKRTDRNTSQTKSGQKLDKARTKVGQNPDQKRKEENRGEENNTSSLRSDVCAEPVSTDSAPATTADIVATFPCQGKLKEWHLLASHVADWKATYPGLDIETEVRKARAWILAKPSNRKTARGMQEFLFRWFDKAVNSSVSQKHQTQSRLQAPIIPVSQAVGLPPEFFGLPPKVESVVTNG